MRLARKSRVMAILILTVCIITGCINNDKDTGGDITSSSPTTEDREDGLKEKDQVIDNAIAVGERIRLAVEKLDGVENSMVYINHESVLVAVELEDQSLEISYELRNDIYDIVYQKYEKAKIIAISNDNDAYQSVSRLVRSYKENDDFKLFLRDMKEIVDKVFKRGNPQSI